jgi:hypothetical protein
MAMVVITGPLRERVALSRAMVWAADTGQTPERLRDERLVHLRRRHHLSDVGIDHGRAGRLAAL